MKTVVLQASARSKGDTHIAINHLKIVLDFDALDILDYKISPYSYLNDYPADDNYYELIETILQYDHIIFATPVYWYTMSAQLKIFLDRISDLLKEKKELGRQLRGKSMSLLSCSNSDDLSNYFAEPFELSAGYLGMHYQGSVHLKINNQGEINQLCRARLKMFINNVEK